MGFSSLSCIMQWVGKNIPHGEGGELIVSFAERLNEAVIYCENNAGYRVVPNGAMDVVILVRNATAPCRVVACTFELRP